MLSRDNIQQQPAWSQRIQSFRLSYLSINLLTALLCFSTNTFADNESFESAIVVYMKGFKECVEAHSKRSENIEESKRLYAEYIAFKDKAVSNISETSFVISEQISSWLNGKLELIDMAAQRMDAEFSGDTIQKTLDTPLLADSFLIMFAASLPRIYSHQG